MGLFRFTNVFMSDEKESKYYEFLKLWDTLVIVKNGDFLPQPWYFFGKICEIVSCNNKMKFVIENAEIMKVLILLDNVGIVRLNAWYI